MGVGLSEAHIRKTTEIVRQLSDDAKERSERLSKCAAPRTGRKLRPTLTLPGSSSEVYEVEYLPRNVPDDRANSRSLA